MEFGRKLYKVTYRSVAFLVACRWAGVLGYTSMREGEREEEEKAGQESGKMHSEWK